MPKISALPSVVTVAAVDFAYTVMVGAPNQSRKITQFNYAGQIIALAFGTQAANLVYAGPSTGAAAAPTFRALVAADIPVLPYISNVTVQTANFGLLGPVTGAAAAPTFRALVTADLGATMTPQFARIGVGIAADGTIPAVIMVPAIGVTPTDALLLENTTAAANAAQQLSPSIHWSGRGWASGSSTSELTDVIAYILPVQGLSNPIGHWRLDFSNNGSAFTNTIDASASAVTIAVNTIFSSNVTINGAASDLILATAGTRLRIKEGVNATMGTGVLNGITEVTIATNKVTANSRIFFSIETPGGTPSGAIYSSSRSAGVSFGVKGLAADSSTFAWMIVEPAP